MKKVVRRKHVKVTATNNPRSWSVRVDIRCGRISAWTSEYQYEWLYSADILTLWSFSWICRRISVSLLRIVRPAIRPLNCITVNKINTKLRKLFRTNVKNIGHVNVRTRLKLKDSNETKKLHFFSEMSALPEKKNKKTLQSTPTPTATT